MSELKAFDIVVAEEYYCEGIVKYRRAVYDKSEADKVIENRDAEIARLKDSIGKLLKVKTEQVMDEVLQKCLIYGEGFVPVEHAMKLVAETRHSNYKRCLAMTECRDAQARLFHRFGTEVMLHQLYGMEPEVDMEQMDRRSSRCRLASQLWKKRAEKFKEAK